jgi:hypothetical protein
MFTNNIQCLKSLTRTLKLQFFLAKRNKPFHILSRVFGNKRSKNCSTLGNSFNLQWHALSSTGRNRLKIALLAFLKVCAEFAAQYPHKKTRNLPLILYISFNLASKSNFAKKKKSWKALRHIFKILNANLRI